MSVTSPMMLAARPKRGKGVRRLNRMPVYLGVGAVAMVIGVVAYTYHQRMAAQQMQQQTQDDNNGAVGSGDLAKDFFSRSAGTPPATTSATQPPIRTAIDQRVVTSPAVDEVRKKAWDQYFAQIAALQQSRADAEIKAMTSDSDLGAGASGSSDGAGAVIPAGGSGSGPSGASSGLPVAGVDASGQAEKRAFLNQSGDPLGINEDLTASLHGPKLDTIMQGTALAGTMIGGLTSDMPGMVVGEIQQNIYDTATGNDLLIPQGSRVIGTYDNSVSGGQERIGVIWNRIVFPDTSSIQIGSMEGADQGGYAGFKDLVDKHFWDKFASATIISIAGAAAQVAQPQQSAFSGYSPTSVASGQLTQGYSSLGQEYARAGLSIPNTIEIRPGYAFTIMVNKDMHLPPYRDRRNAAAQTFAGPVLQ